MALGRGQCPDTTDTIKKQTMALVSPDVLGKGFTNCCSPDEMVGREDEEEAENVRMLAAGMTEIRWEL
jgi:hypothetical protein